MVHRSQKDPLIDENEHGQMVLAANTDVGVMIICYYLIYYLIYYCYIIVILQVACLSHEDQQKEQQKYGIFFKDEYNYLQHLKEPSSTQPVVLDVKDKVYSKDILFVYIPFLLMVVLSKTC